ncbi:MAG: 3-oxoacyl-ACP reductase FabG [Lentisphaeria bacterium]|nr:3-oxoacyl-ACP reductase FabG [Lentisphaeria bacterium]
MKEKDHAQTALIIGGCRGIGRAIALRLAKDGFNIAATCRKKGVDSEAVEKEVSALGRQCRILELDVCDREGTRRLLADVFGQNAPDAVIYNSGIARDNLFVFMENAEWDNVLDTNLKGFYNAVQPLVFGMLAKRRGRIVVVSSASGQTGQAGQVNYSASKAGLIGAVKALAREVGRKGILVNAVAPGVIETEMTRDLPKEQVLPLIPLHRVGQAEEVAGAVSFLCGPDSSYIHGQVLAVNGGLVI